MNRLVLAAAVLVAGTVGFLIGRAAPAAGRADRGSAEAPVRHAERREVSMPTSRAQALEREAAEAATLRAENARLLERIAALEPKTDDALPDGSRRKDSSIVGGARWSTVFRRTATAFLDTYLDNFIKEAHLTAEQQHRLRAEMHTRVGQAMAITADFTNGDIEGGRAYELLEIATGDGVNTLSGILDPEQLKVYGRFENSIKDMLHGQVVNNEMAALNAELDLNPEQARNIRAIVNDRWTQVGRNLRTGIPNVMFKPIRRATDREIFRKTADRIGQYLSASQQAAFREVEQNAAALPYQFRTMLVPK